MDPQLRKLLEVSYEAWIDSGIDHVALRGSNQVCSSAPPASVAQGSSRHAHAVVKCLKELEFSEQVGTRLSCAAVICSEARTHQHASLVQCARPDYETLGLQVGVYVGCCGSEIHAQWLANVNEITGYEQTGCTLSMFANRLSFSFDFQGPSKAVDTGLCMRDLL